MFHTLRRIQKKERDNGTLAHVEETFYEDIHVYLNKLKKSAIDNPFSDVYNTLNEARRIAIEICEKREYKITMAAVLNSNRSYELFVGEQNFDLVDSMPLNLTPEEEVFYFSLIDTLKNHKLNLSGQSVPSSPQKTAEDDSIKEPKNDTPNSEADNDTIKIKEEVKSPTVSDAAEKAAPKPENDEVLNRIDEISRAKVITDEKPESIEKQISKSREIEIKDDKDQFIDLDSEKRIRDAEIVTLLIFDNIDPIMGIDEKVYGPFRPQDVVMLPRINANIFVKARKGRFVKI